MSKTKSLNWWLFFYYTVPIIHKEFFPLIRTLSSINFRLLWILLWTGSFPCTLSPVLSSILLKRFRVNPTTSTNDISLNTLSPSPLVFYQVHFINFVWTTTLSFCPLDTNPQLFWPYLKLSYTEVSLLYCNNSNKICLAVSNCLMQFLFDLTNLAFNNCYFILFFIFFIDF